MSLSDNNVPQELSNSERLKVFNALGSDTRLKMVEKLCEGEMHISELARELNISVPVAAKHATILEEAQLIERKVYGKTHVLKLNNKNIVSALDVLAPTKYIEVPKGTTLLEALKKVAVVEVRQDDDFENVVSTNGEEGFFVYEVDGKFPDKTVKDCRFEKDAIVEWKKLEAVTKLKINIKVKDEE
ncbi:MAG: ArsR family transcriptional regulator [Methanomethylovorans sp.]|jgi:DNA-binding transcriptional ArsR family regulator|nr:ArsR family transcriptional regulator [Methanomethylovorans sp.]